MWTIYSQCLLCVCTTKAFLEQKKKIRNPDKNKMGKCRVVPGLSCDNLNCWILMLKVVCTCWPGVYVVVASGSLSRGLVERSPGGECGQESGLVCVDTRILFTLV